MAKHCDGFFNVMRMCWVTEINNFAFIFYQVRSEDGQMLAKPQELMAKLSSSNSLDDFLIESEDETDLEVKEKDAEGLSCTCLKNSLDTSFDILADNEYYKVSANIFQ